MFETRFTQTLKLLQTTMGNHVRRHDLHGPLLVLLWNRLSRTIRLFTRLATLWRAGTLPKPRPSRAGRTRTPTPPKPLTIPRNRTWLIDLTRGPAALAAAGLRTLMTDAELCRFLAECPQARRLLRPIAQMLGMSPSEPELAPIRLPPRARKPRPPKPPRLRLRPRHFTRAQIAKMTAAELTHLYGRIPPHFPLPVPNFALIRRKIAQG